MQTQRRSLSKFHLYNVVSFVVCSSFVIVFGLGFVGVKPRANEGAYARTNASCSSGDLTHVVVGSEKLVTIVAHYGYGLSLVATYNHIAWPYSLHPNQIICIPGNAMQRVSTALDMYNLPAKAVTPLALTQSQAHPVVRQSTLQQVSGESRASAGVRSFSRRASFLSRVAVGIRNAFPYGQCTWWAAQRFYQLHHVFVPWTHNANAGQWVDRARQYGWHVSSVPSVGSIMVLQPYVQGASAAGHVGIVEKLFNKGTKVVVSSMNWNFVAGVTYSSFSRGRGVAFISE